MKYSLRSLLLFTAGCALVLLLVRMAYLRYLSMFEGLPVGFVSKREDWPQALKQLISHEQLRLSEIENISVYRLYDWGFDSEYFWKFQLNPQLVKVFTEERNLDPVPSDDVAIEAFLNKLPNDWSPPDLSQDCETYSTPGFMHIYTEGEILVVIIDSDQQKIFVWYVFHF